VIGAGDAKILEYQIGLSVLFREWIPGDAVVFEELRESHGQMATVKMGEPSNLFGL
jgi:hypothetical protein